MVVTMKKILNAIVIAMLSISGVYAQGDLTSSSDSVNNLQTNGGNPVAAIVSDNHAVTNTNNPKQVYPTNGLTAPSISPTLFQVDHSPVVSGVIVSTYATAVCPEEYADANTLATRLDILSTDDDWYSDVNNRNKVKDEDIDISKKSVSFTPRSSFVHAKSGGAFVAVIPGSKLDGKKVKCVGIIFAQAKKDNSEKDRVSKEELLHDERLFMANIAPAGHRYLIVDMGEVGTGAARHVESDSLGATLSPAISAVGNLLTGSIGGFSYATGDTGPASQLGVTALVVEVTDSGYFIQTPAQYDVNRQLEQDLIKNTVEEQTKKQKALAAGLN
jgi:hypothetical protein